MIYVTTLKSHRILFWPYPKQISTTMWTYEVCCMHWSEQFWGSTSNLCEWPLQTGEVLIQTHWITPKCNPKGIVNSVSVPVLFLLLVLVFCYFHFTQFDDSDDAETMQIEPNYLWKEGYLVWTRYRLPLSRLYLRLLIYLIFLLLLFFALCTNPAISFYSEEHKRHSN